jgi:hypothetical protein
VQHKKNQNKSNKDKLYAKVVVIQEIYNFAVYDFHLKSFKALNLCLKCSQFEIDFLKKSNDIGWRNFLNLSCSTQREQ